MLVDEPTAPILHPPNWNSRWQRHFFTKRRGKGLVPVAPISYWQDENSNNWSPFQKMRVKTYHKIKSEYFIKFVIVFKEHLDACSWNFTTVKGMNWDVRICSLNNEASKINKKWLVYLSTQKAIPKGTVWLLDTYFLNWALLVFLLEFYQELNDCHIIQVPTDTQISISLRSFMCFLVFLFYIKSLLTKNETRLLLTRQ